MGTGGGADPLFRHTHQQKRRPTDSYEPADRRHLLSLQFYHASTRSSGWRPTGALESISLRRFSWFTSLAPGSKSMAEMFDSGKRWRSSLIMPFPVTWLGRQAKGCTQAMLGTPDSMSSTISAVQPAQYFRPNLFSIAITKCPFSLRWRLQIFIKSSYGVLPPIYACPYSNTPIRNT